MRVTILGAGVLGLSAARASALRGHEVYVNDPRQPGAGASGKAAGIVSAVCHEPDDVQLVQETRRRLAEAGLLHEVGSLTVTGPHQGASLVSMAQRLQRAGESFEILDAASARGRFPELRMDSDEQALWVPADGVVEPGDVVAWLQAQAVEQGVRLVKKREAADKTVVAAGAWTPGILASMGIDLPIAAFRTQAAHLTGVHTRTAIHDVVHGCYFRPDGSGMLFGNGTRLWPHDPESYNERGGPDFEQSIAARLPARWDGAESARIVNSWAGLCVATPDARPVCGPVAQDTWVLSGDNGHGLMRCLALGERLAKSIDGQTHPETDPARLTGISEWQMREGFAW